MENPITNPNSKRATKYTLNQPDFLRIANALPSSVSYVNKEYEYCFVNATYEKWFGRKKEEIEGKHIRCIVGEKGFEKSKNALDKAFKGEHVLYERKLFFTDKKTHYLSVHYTPAKDKNDQIIGAYVFAEDITDLKINQLALEKSNEHLERFAFIASHDLKTPIRNISMYAGLLKRKLKKLSEREVNSLLEDIQGRCHQVYDIIESVLEVSKLRNSIKKVAQFDCTTIVNQAKQDLKSIIQKKKATINCTPLPILNGDKNLLLTVFINLIENGIKYNEAEKPVINISYCLNNNKHEFKVSDNGIGIAPEYHEKIFKMFKRLHNSHEYEGTGIGLANCKRILELHGGEIWMEPAQLSGSRFIFTLPVQTQRENS